MRLRVLGCHGGESPSHRAACLLVNDDLLLDAGAVTRSLSLPGQALVDYVFVSHSHLDHVYGLALMVDNVIGVRTRPIDVICSPGTATALRTHLFNNVLWPDFTKIPLGNASAEPILRIRSLDPSAAIELGSYHLRLVPVAHPVETHAVVVAHPHGNFIYTGDTGPTERIWREASAMRDLRALVCEVSFPDELEALARQTGHLTPSLLAEALAEFAPQTTAPVLLCHLKPRFVTQLKEQLDRLRNPRLRVLNPMDDFEF